MFTNRKNTLYKFIKKSKLFDKKWYLNKNQDVYHAGIDPLKHYLLYGWQEGRLPNKNYANQYNCFDICPLIHTAIQKHNCLRKIRIKHYKSLVLPKNTSYNFFASIGGSCYCSEHLRIAKLQTYSLPFDWLTHECFYPKTNCRHSMDIYLLNVINLITNDFKNFISKEDFIEIPGLEGDKNNKFYINKRNGLQFLHEFSKALPFDDAYKDFAEKYTRRYLRFLDNIKKSNRLIFVWSQDLLTQLALAEEHSTINTDECLVFARQLLVEKLKNNNLDILVFNHNKNMEENEIHTDIINNHIYRYTSNHEFTKTYNPENGAQATTNIYNILSKFVLKTENE